MASKIPAAKAKKLQEMLNKLVKPSPPLEVDGLIGPKTKEAIKLMQAKAGLKKTGVPRRSSACELSRKSRSAYVCPTLSNASRASQINVYPYDSCSIE